MRAVLVAQFLRFGVVGFAGFLVDTSVVYALRGQLGLPGAGIAGWAAAATMTWALNRGWTFRTTSRGDAHRQWGLYLVMSLAGFVLNRGAFTILVLTVPLCAANPVLATAAGAIAGMGANFLMARNLVFR